MSEKKSGFSVKLTNIIDKFSLEEIHSPENIDEIIIDVPDLNRPGLQLAGFYEFFDNDRIQILGRNEISYLRELGDEKYAERIDMFMSKKPPCVIITRDFEVDRPMLTAQWTRLLLFRLRLTDIWRLSLPPESPVTAFWSKYTAKASCCSAKAASEKAKLRSSLLNEDTD